MMTHVEDDLLIKVKELVKENEKLKGALKNGRNANQNLSSLIIGLTADNERLTEDNKKLAELNSKLYEENLKLAKDKQHLWEDVVTLKKNVDDFAQLHERIDELEEEKKALVNDLKSLRESVTFNANILKELVDFTIPGEDDDNE